ncbi:MAG: OpgC domain-containing protein [Alphaproteobacteria bacterium]|nr:OpgC domain-containing protein [Alphaproteobacteria bacterium]
MNPIKVERDRRLDFFRGLALIFIFIDHVPGNRLAYVTLGGWNFCDAAEVFVFISGYTAALVFGAMYQRMGPLLAAIRVFGRCWTLYVAHVFLFVIFMTEVSYTAERFNNPMFVEEMRVDEFLRTPHIAALNALALRFQPAFMDILPLYIVLMLGLLVFLPLIARRPWVAVGLSLAVYLFAHRMGFNLATYPDGEWLFNPLAWQLLFVIGACLGYPRAERWPGFVDRPWLLPLVVTVLFLCIAGKLFLAMASVHAIDLPRIARVLWWGNSKSWLGPYRLVNILALAYLAGYLIKPGMAWLNALWVRPILRMGENSLYVFCLGIFLSYLGHLILVEISSRVPMQLAVSLAGVAIMMAVAEAMSGTKRAEARRRRAAPA